MRTPQYANEPTRAPDLRGEVRVLVPDTSTTPASMLEAMQRVINAPTVPGESRAWRVTPAPEILAVPHAPPCGQWLVHAPHGHPFWPWYVVQAISLRPVDGLPPAHLQFPGASHEWLVLALSPEEPLPDVDRWGAPGTPPMHHLEPIDQCVQFIVADDEQATELCEKTVETIVHGISPDQDYRAWWTDAISHTAEHLRLGGHPDG